MRRLSITIDEAELPLSVRGECAKDADGRFYVLVNKNLPEPEKALAFLHEALHIWHDDFTSEAPVSAIEAARHEELVNMLKSEVGSGADPARPEGSGCTN